MIMKKTILKLFKNLILSFILIYTLNLILSNVNLFIPINVFTIIITTLLGPPGLLSLIIILFFIK